MSQQELLKKVIQALEHAGIDYMLTGSIVSSLQGEPRSTHEPFDRSRFSRRITEDFQGIAMCISRPEDTILAKLRWAALSGGSEKQFTDALRVYEVQYGILDMRYLEHWALILGVEPLLMRLKQEAETM